MFNIGAMCYCEIIFYLHGFDMTSKNQILNHSFLYIRYDIKSSYVCTAPIKIPHLPSDCCNILYLLLQTNMCKHSISLYLTHIHLYWIIVSITGPFTSVAMHPIWYLWNNIHNKLSNNLQGANISNIVDIN